MYAVKTDDSSLPLAGSASHLPPGQDDRLGWGSECTMILVRLYWPTFFTQCLLQIHQAYFAPVVSSRSSDGEGRLSCETHVGLSLNSLELVACKAGPITRSTIGSLGLERAELLMTGALSRLGVDGCFDTPVRLKSWPPHLLILDLLQLLPRAFISVSRSK